jgi:hypothetical protein
LADIVQSDAVLVVKLLAYLNKDVALERIHAGLDERYYQLNVKAKLRK